MSSRPWQPWLVAALLLVAVVAAHGPVLENAFVGFDDPVFVLQVDEVTTGLRWRNVVWAFTAIEESNYFPVTRLSWMLDAELYGLEARGFHATSLALHAVNALLLFVALYRLTRELWPSAFVAAVFAVHPLHVESVAWISTRKDLVSGLFFMLSLIAYERRVRGQHPRAWGAALVVVFALGLLSKQVLVTLPCLLLLLDVWPLGRWRRQEIWPLVREKAVLFGLAFGLAGITLVAQQGAMASTEIFPLPLRALNAIFAYLDYVERFLWPRNLAVLYPISLVLGLRLAVAVAVLTAATAFALRSLGNRPWFFVGWFWFTGMLVPMIGLVQVGSQASADRYTYLPLAGLSIGVAWGAKELVGRVPEARRRSAQASVAAVSVVVLGLLVTSSRTQVATWKDSWTLFEHAVAVTRDNAGASWRLGLLLQQRGDPQAAVPHLQQALRLNPKNEEIRLALETAREELREKARNEARGR
jgi:hypothetical protein